MINFMGDELLSRRAKNKRNVALGLVPAMALAVDGVVAFKGGLVAGCFAAASAAAVVAVCALLLRR